MPIRSHKEGMYLRISREKSRSTPVWQQPCIHLLYCAFLRIPKIHRKLLAQIESQLTTTIQFEANNDFWSQKVLLMTIKNGCYLNFFAPSTKKLTAGGGAILLRTAFISDLNRSFSSGDGLIISIPASFSLSRFLGT